MQKYFLLLLLLLFSCRGKQKQAVAADSTPLISKKQHQKQVDGPWPQLWEFFTDSTKIGKKRHNKVELAKYNNRESIYVIIKFYAKLYNKWNIKNEFRFQKDGITSCDANVSDFNHDGFDDLTYVSASAARGSNEVRRLFIYDKENDKLIYLKYSEDYPNMLYNKELNCIDAFVISGCRETVFLKIQKDSLHKFARVSLCDSLTISTYDQQGREKRIIRKKNTYDDFTRFKNYHPLRVY